jgi:biopolymer transport protein ExbB
MVVVVAPTLGLPMPVFAQAEEAARTISWFSMFFLSGDLIGVAIIWLLLGLSALSLGYTVQLSLQSRRSNLLPEGLQRDIGRLLSAGQLGQARERAENDASLLARLVGSALDESGKGYPAMQRAIEEASDTETTRILRPIEYLNVLGNISPMIGLFGTVYGMIVAFQQLVASGGRPDPAQLAGGISTALVTTFWGLIVAIPALAAYALIRNKIDALTSEAVVLAEHLMSGFRRDEGSEAGGREAGPGTLGSTAGTKSTS